MSALTAQQIADQLRSAKASAEVLRIQQAFEPRRTEIRARLAEIVDQVNRPPARTRAILQGPAAVSKLDDEIGLLQQELDCLVDLEGACNEKLEELLRSEWARAIPAARKRLPQALQQVRATLAAFETAIAEANDLVEMLANYGNLPGEPLPLSDEQLADLIGLRNTIWSPRHLKVIQPPEKGYPRSWAQFYESHGGKYDLRIRPRRPGLWLPDFVHETAPGGVLPRLGRN